MPLKINLTPDRLHSLDPGDILGKTLELPRQMRVGQDVARIFLEKHSLPPISELDWCGLGGSAVAGDLLQAFGAEPIPIFVQRVTNTNMRPRLVCSYSGNTVESVYAFTSVPASQVWMSMSSGGKLAELAAKKRVPHLLLPDGYPPRTATGFMLGAMLTIFEKAFDYRLEDFEKLISTLEADALRYRELNPEKNLALDFARKLVDRTPVIYAVDGLGMTAVANRFRSQLAENSKVWSHTAQLPELAHNEVESFANLAQLLPPPLVILLGSWQNGELFSDPRAGIQNILDDLNVQHLTLDPIALWEEDSIRLAVGLRMLMLLDAITVYLAFLRAVDPMDIPVITTLKKSLTKA